MSIEGTRGNGWIILAVVAIVIVILGIVAYVALDRMRESAVNLDFSSALGNYGIFFIAGIIIVLIVIVAAWLLTKR